jgi:hypothetical protein
MLHSLLFGHLTITPSSMWPPVRLPKLHLFIKTSDLMSLFFSGVVKIGEDVKDLTKFLDEMFTKFLDGK